MARRSKRRGNKTYGKKGTGRNENSTKNTKERSIEKWGEIGLKRWRKKKRRIVRDNEKGICFHSRSAGS